MVISVAFYIDKSGSMSNCIDNVFDAYDAIAKGLTSLFKRDSAVSNIDYKTFVFDTTVTEIKFGKRVNADGGTFGFEDILNYIKNHTSNFTINVIITDAEFSSIQTEPIKTFLDTHSGMLAFITNNSNGEPKIEGIANTPKYKHKMKFIKASSDFSLS